MYKKKSPCILAIVAATFLLLAVFAPTAHAHGFGERYDLPLPLTYFVFAGAAAVVLSFVVVGMFVRGQHDGSGYPRLNLFRAPVLQLILTGPVTWLLRAASLFLFFLVIATGLFGSERPVNNLTPTFVWIIWWVGMGFVASLLGNLWAVVNPWKILFGLAESVFHRFNPEWELTLGMDYAERVGVWPSVALFFAFVWVENALPEAASPALLAWLIAAYSVVTLGGMYLFGKHQWLRHGEVFTVIYGFLSRFSITEVRANDSEVCGECAGPSCGPSMNSGRSSDGLRVSGESMDGGGCVDCYECFEYAGDRELNLRPPAIGLHSRGAMPAGLTALVLLVLSTVTFDGFSDTPEWAAVLGWALTQTPQLTSPYFNGLVIANTLGLALFPLAFAGVYWVFSALMLWVVERSGGESPVATELMTAFVFSLVPIALAYHFAHYLGFLLIQGQLIIPLASDPFGAGANLFGTAGYVVNLTVTNARFIWIFAVISIVAGHIIAVYLAHLRANTIYGGGSVALKSQLPMLALMVIYTVASLWIISRPITE
ncbi:MAG: hypothetical protein OXR67_05225 [Chloroflexota bacterium]|nr:hypothetical protein [Chloroflexota bacterium]